ncbi:DUF885 family protein [Comamonas sp. GB3 AK4-5]|uniref:DUF885 domain-containing protein n=1 Tax=Comamonas sp. GB3 AK4-5 TaxID=3231487 RepID=UPI00351E5002
MQPHSRREFLLAAISATTLSAVPDLAQAQTSTTADQRFALLLDDFAEEVLSLAPSNATSLGLDKGKRAGLKSRLEDMSPTGDANWASACQSMANRLGTIARATLSGHAQTRYDTVAYAIELGAQGAGFSLGRASAGFQGITMPYPVNQQDCALTRIPEFLDAQHQIGDAADAEAYLARLATMATMLDQETARVADQARQGIAPPSFVCQTALGQLQDFRKTPAAQQKLLTSITERTQNIAGDWHARALKLVQTSVYPALERQIATLGQAATKASDIAGVHHLPEGDAYYEWALRLGTSTTHSPEKIHAIGLEQNLQLQSRIDALLKKRGFTQGSVGERLQALTKNPANFYANDEQGREALIAYCNARVAAMRKLMPQLSRLNLQAPLQIKRVPIDIEAGAPLGFMNFASLDGARPAIYYINLKSTMLWPKSELATLTAHEGIPGHAWQGAYLAEHHDKLPLMASLINLNAFTEGWALYAEQLVDELGLYVDDPLSQIGYLQAQQFRACRLVVDTGIHAKRWTREQAVRFLVENTGRGLQAMTSEVDRYAVMPGQACGYKMGHNDILRQRARAQQALAGEFDLASFNDALVQSGGVPLTVLPSVIDRYIAQRKKA